jgi:poly-gamma-glutamate synthesis protein (capsule biosynthesis protein)
MLGRLVDTAIAEHGFAYPWGDVLPVLRQADLRFANLECTLTQSSDRTRDGAYKAFYLRARPCAVETLKQADISFASLANNHACDFGFEGLEDTLAVLAKAGIAHAGAGRTLAEARAPALLDARGLKVAVVACADSPTEWAATAETPGIYVVHVPPRASALAEMCAAVAEARRQADLCVVSMHGGEDMRDRPPREFRDLARRLMDAGADVFWGHSAHLVQGIEWYRERPILYDAGSFVDDYEADALLRNDLSAIFLVTVEAARVLSVRVVPVAIAHLRVGLARGRDRSWFVRRLAELCGEMGSEVVGAGRAVLVEPSGSPAALALKGSSTDSPGAGRGGARALGRA